jgi:hypothetical protein
MKKHIFFMLILVTILLSSCGTKAISSDQYLYDSGAPMNGGAEPPMPASEAMAPMADGSRSTTVKTDFSSTQLQERLVIQNADLSIVVADPQTKMSAISAMAKELGGFVVSSNMYQTYLSNGEPVPEGSIVIRVPAEKLDSALNQIKSDAVEVRNENRSGQDVTQDYIDLNSQLHSMQAAADQLTRIMQSAEKTEDVLNVFTQLQSYNQQIEVIKGQIQYYEQASALSAISITLIAEETIQPIEIGGWKPQGVARDAIQSLIRFWQGFVDFMINFFLLALPVFITILIPFYLLFLLVRAIVRRLRRKKTPKSAE